MPMLEFEEEKRFSRFRQKPAKLFIALGSVCALVLGYTFAGNITLNNDQAVEFGQGVVQTVACDTDGLILTPYSRFINGDSNFAPITLTANSNGLASGRLLYTSTSLSSIKVGDNVAGEGIPADSFITNISGGFFAINNSYDAEIITSALTISRPPGRFLLSEIELAEIDAENCANKALTIKVYNSTSSSSLATYEVFSTGYEVSSASGQIDISFYGEGEAEMFLTIEEPTVAATDVYRITIESKDLINLALNRIGFWPGFFTGPGSDYQIPNSSDGEDFYCSGGVCDIAFLPATDFLQLIFETECNMDPQCFEVVDAFRSATYSLSKNNSPDPDMAWQILITQSGAFGPFANTLHLSGQILYSNGEYAVFRWYGNTDDASNPTIDRTYNDLIISFSQSLPISNTYTGPPLFGEPSGVTLYELSWTY